MDRIYCTGCQLDDAYEAAVRAELSGRLAEAEKLYQISYEQHGNRISAYNLCRLHFEGRGRPRCLETALEYAFQSLQKTPGYEDLLL